MDMLIELLTELLGADHELVALLNQRAVEGDRPWAELTDEQILETLEGLRALHENEEASTDVIALAADAYEALVAEQTLRDEEAAADEARRQEAIARMTPEAEDGDEDEESDADGDSTDDDADGDAEDATETETAAEPEPVAAGGTPAPPRRLAARRSRPRQPDPATAGAHDEVPLRATSNGGGFTAGQALDVDQLAEAFRRSSVTAARHAGSTELIPIARMSILDRYPEDRFLRAEDGHIVNMRKIRDVTNRAAVTASGGICEPLAVRYDIPTIVTDARPLRDSLPNFGASRGGITFIPPTPFEDFAGASEVWTAETDATPGEATKDRLTVTCPDTDEANVDAITLRFKFGNFQSRFHPEGVSEAITNGTAYHARRGEVKIWDDICTGSLDVDLGQGLGALSDFLAHSARISAVYRSSNRVPENTMLEMRVPFWLFDLLRADATRRAPGDGMVAVTNAEIAAWARNAGINLIPVLEGGTGQQFARQGAGPLQGWPSTVEVLVFESGTWIFLDGGTLDIGEVRDSTLVGTNDYEMFSETFEGVAKVGGPDSWCVTFDLCPSGELAALGDYDPCSIGS